MCIPCGKTLFWYQSEGHLSRLRSVSWSHLFKKMLVGGFSDSKAQVLSPRIYDKVIWTGFIHLSQVTTLLTSVMGEEQPVA